MQANGYPWVLDVGRNLGLCGLQFALVHHTRISTLEQDHICAWMIENDQHQFLNGLDLPQASLGKPIALNKANKTDQKFWCKTHKGFRAAVMTEPNVNEDWEKLYSYTSSEHSCYKNKKLYRLRVQKCSFG